VGEDVRLKPGMPPPFYRKGYDAMAFIATARGVEVVLRAHQGAVPVVNVFHVDAHAAVTDTILTNILEVFTFWVTTYWLPLLNESYVIDQIMVKDISEEGGAEQVANFVTANAGALTGIPLGAGSALVISWRTIKTGRSFRGRTYVPAIDADKLLDAHLVATAWASDVIDAASALLDALAAAGYALSVLSLVANKVARVAGLLSEIVTIVVNNVIDSQRRRNLN